MVIKSDAEKPTVKGTNEETRVGRVKNERVEINRKTIAELNRQRRSPGLDGSLIKWLIGLDDGAEVSGADWADWDWDRDEVGRYYSGSLRQVQWLWESERRQM